MVNAPTMLWIRSAIDILVVAFIIYRGLLLIKGTRAATMLWGLATVVVLYFAVAKPLGLATLSWLLESFFSSIILVAVILFQDEIRRGLTKVGLNPLYRRADRRLVEKTVEDIALVCSKLARSKIGALIVIQREVGLDEFLEDAVVLDAQLDRKLLQSIFLKDSPLHDGAVLIVENRIRAAGCVLPLSFNPDLDPSLGTRHRAALGLSERSDAVVLVVSEENGSISLVQEGRMVRNLDGAMLRDALHRIFASNGDELESEESA